MKSSNLHPRPLSCRRLTPEERLSRPPVGEADVFAFQPLPSSVTLTFIIGYKTARAQLSTTIYKVSGRIRMQGQFGYFAVSIQTCVGGMNWTNKRDPQRPHLASC